MVFLIKNYKVLHFEDDDKLSDIYRKAFIRAGLKYWRIKNPKKNFIEQVVNIKPGIILMDTSLPGQDGFSLAKILQKHKQTSKIPIVGLSDVERSVGVRWALNLGMYDYWMHDIRRPEKIAQKIYKILNPAPYPDRDSLISVGWLAKKIKLFFKHHQAIWHYALVILFMMCGPAIIYFNNIFIKTADDFITKLPTRLSVELHAVNFSWQYQGEKFIIEKTLYGRIDEFYKNSDLKFFGENDALDEYYKFFSTQLSAGGDNTINDFSEQIIKQGNERNLSEDQLVELSVGFVQSIPFDEEKKEAILNAPEVSDGDNQSVLAAVKSSWPRFPYETLYDNKGVCTDKTFLAIALLQQLGYGTAIFDYQTHIAPAVKCTDTYSNFNSGYCIAEVTSNGFFIGELPAIMDSYDQTVKKDVTYFSQKMWNIGLTEEIIQKPNIVAINDGKSYERISQHAPIFSEMNKIENEFNDLNAKISLLLEKINALEKEVKTYKDTVNEISKKLQTDNSLQLYYQYEEAANKYNSAFEKHEGGIAEYEASLISQNKLITEYQQLLMQLEIN
ncbi:MAG: response regulator [Patescibacteria group bacterium]|jgi:CheY-like chemotaxis protein